MVHLGGAEVTGVAERVAPWFVVASSCHPDRVQHAGGSGARCRWICNEADLNRSACLRRALSVPGRSVDAVNLSPDERALLDLLTSGAPSDRHGLHEPDEQAMLRWLTDGQRRPHRPRPTRQHRTRPTFVPRGERAPAIPEPQPSGLSAYHAREWAERYFTSDQVSAWVTAGLKIHEAWLAEELRDVRITPAMLSIVIRKQTILDRLRDGLSPAQVRRLIDRESGA
jgi:hypothetical protein